MLRIFWIYSWKSRLNRRARSRRRDEWIYLLGRQMHKKGSDAPTSDTIASTSRCTCYSHVLMLVVRVLIWGLLPKRTLPTSPGGFFLNLNNAIFEFSALGDFSCPLVPGTAGFAGSIFPWRAADVNALPITHLIGAHGVSQIFIDTAG